MAHFDQRPHSESIDPAVTARNARIGLILFTVYCAFYVTFMVVNAFAPQLMETIVFAGINLAVAYGLGLIITAFVLALLYAWLCRSGAQT
jgi:uncharacterized membrane protein (DUF485 family)